MRALVYSTDYELAVLEVEPATPRPDEVLVRVEAAGICGSDVHGVGSRSPRRQPPLIMGHELVGEVVEAGDASAGALVGELVAINPQVPCGRCQHCRSGRENVCAHRELVGGTRPGGFAEYVCVPARCAHRVGDTDPAAAVFAEPLATCVHAFSLAPPPVAGSAVVLGAGTIGVLAAELLRRLGVAEIVLSDPDERRRSVAAAVADSVVAPEDLAPTVADLTSGRGASLTVDAVGVEAARRQSLEVLEIGGTAVWLGMHAHEAAIPAFDAVVREQRVQGSFAYTDPEFAAAVRLLGAGGLEPAVSHDSFALEDGAGAFRSMVAGEAPAAMKAILRPSQRLEPSGTYAG